MINPWYLNVPEHGSELTEPRCVTCSDAVEVMELQCLESPTEALAFGNRGPVRIDISLLTQASVGERILVHGGVALGSIGGDETPRVKK